MLLIFYSTVSHGSHDMVFDQGKSWVSYDPRCRGRKEATREIEKPMPKKLKTLFDTRV
jgi:hypothetical protein